MTLGVDLIEKERNRQIDEEGWNYEHDDTYKDWELLKASICYLIDIICSNTFFPCGIDPRTLLGNLWPWDPKWWKRTPDDQVKQLVKAGALIAAEIDRIKRNS